MTVEKPILDVEQAIEIYKHLITSKPNFGTDIYADGFKPEKVFLIEDNSFKSKGKPIRFDALL